MKSIVNKKQKTQGKSYNEAQRFYPLPVGEFRWDYKYISDQSMSTTTRVGCFLVYTSKR